MESELVENRGVDIRNIESGEVFREIHRKMKLEEIENDPTGIVIRDRIIAPEEMERV